MSFRHHGGSPFRMSSMVVRAASFAVRRYVGRAVACLAVNILGGFSEMAGFGWFVAGVAECAVEVGQIEKSSVPWLGSVGGFALARNRFRIESIDRPSFVG